MSGQSICKICKSSMTDLYSYIFDNRHGYPGIFKIRHCLSCGFCHSEPSLTKGDLSDVYQKYYPRQTVTIEQIQSGFEKTKKKSKISVWLNGERTSCYRYIKPGGRVLDVGCGDCTSLLMAKHIGAKEVVGIEVDPNVRKFALDLKLNVLIGHLTTISDKIGQFDYILATQVIEHEPEPELLLCEMKKRLSENGVIVLSFPNVGSFYRHVFKDKWIHWHVPYHINHFSKKSVNILAQKCGLTIRKIKTVTPNSWTDWQLRAKKIQIEVGQRDTFWDPGLPNNVQVPVSIFWDFCPSLLERVLRKLLKYFSLFFICIFNRLLDALGLGESFVVILSK